MNIFLDDLRETPDGFERTYTVEQTLQLLQECWKNSIIVNILSLDNDLGENLKEGREVLNKLEEWYYCDGFPLPQEIRIHSSNAAARSYMNTILKKLGKMK